MPEWRVHGPQPTTNPPATLLELKGVDTGWYSGLCGFINLDHA